MRFLDLHSHVLPGLDDGSPDAATSLAMLRGLAALGFGTVCATPHQKSGQFMPTADEISAAYDATKTTIADADFELTLSLAAENMWDDVFYGRVENDCVPSYDGGIAFLVEFQLHRLPIALFDHLFRMRMSGKLPVIAHPERYEPLWSDRDAVQRLRVDCALVCDLGAVAGYHGRRRTKVARAMLKDGIAHAVASDIHSVEDVRVAGEGIEWIRSKLGEPMLGRLLDDNPRRIMAGELPEL